MKPLSETNPYLRDPEQRRRMIEEDVYQSSLFEGARGLPKPASLVPSKRRSIASTKKSVNKS